MLVLAGAIVHEASRANVFVCSEFCVCAMVRGRASVLAGTVLLHAACMLFDQIPMYFSVHAFAMGVAADATAWMRYAMTAQAGHPAWCCEKAHFEQPAEECPV